MRFCIAILALLSTLAAGARPARAQTPASGDTSAASGTDTAFARAQQLVSEGRGDEGRALVETRLRQAAPGSPEYVEALYWRAALAATAVEAERDLRRIVIEYPLAPHADDALLRLAQLELARGDRARARKHLERLALEYPSGAARVRGGLVLARTYFDDRLIPKGCAVLDDLMRAVPESDVEQRNQVEYMRQRCAGMPRGGDDGAAAESGASGASGATGSAAGGAAPSSPRSAAPAAAPSAAPSAGGPPPTSTSPRPAAGAPPEKREPERRSAPAARAASSRGWSVQVAAFRGRAEAEALRKRLVALGWPARVSRSGSLHRVRVGRYATRADAQGAIARMKKQHVDGIVVEAER